jgi:hypothetical protein
MTATQTNVELANAAHERIMSEMGLTDLDLQPNTRIISKDFVVEMDGSPVTRTLVYTLVARHPSQGRYGLIDLDGLWDSHKFTREEEMAAWEADGRDWSTRAKY